MCTSGWHECAFQYTHPGGVRHSLKLLDVVRLPFQFTHPGGVRRILLALVFTERVFQFTHPGGVRRHEGCLRRSPTRFNSRTREGCDQGLSDATVAGGKFQFTHPGGVRRRGSILSTDSVTVSIHAPGRGATQQRYRYHRANQVSIHAPGRGATGTFVHLDSTHFRFNSRTREGCDFRLAR